MANNRVKRLSYTVIFEPQADGSYTVTVPALLECEAEGHTLEEARENAKRAVEGCIENLLKESKPIPRDVRAKPVVEEVAITIGGRKLSYTIIFEPAVEGGYVVLVPALPGCLSEGDTLKEARANIQDAMEGYLEVLREDGKPFPPDIQTQPVYEKITVYLPAVIR